MSDSTDRPPSPAQQVRAAKKAPPKKPRPKRHPQAGPSLQEQAGVLDRRNRAWDLYVAGADLLSIGRQLLRTPARPYGYNPELSEDSLVAMVGSDIHRVKQLTRDALRENVEDHREMQVTRFYRLIMPLWPKAMNGDVKASLAIGSHMANIAKLNGLFEPARIHVDGDDPEVMATVNAIWELIQQHAASPEVPSRSEVGG